MGETGIGLGIALAGMVGASGMGVADAVGADVRDRGVGDKSGAATVGTVSDSEVASDPREQAATSADRVNMAMVRADMYMAGAFNWHDSKGLCLRS